MTGRHIVAGLAGFWASLASCTGDDEPFDPLVNRDTALAALELRSVSVSALYVDAGEAPKVQVSIALAHAVGDAGIADGDRRLCPRLAALTVALESSGSPAPFADPGGWRPRSQQGSFRCASPSTRLDLAPLDSRDAALIVQDGSAMVRIELGDALRPRQVEPAQGRGWDFAVGERAVLRWSPAVETTELGATLEFGSSAGDRGTERVALSAAPPDLLEAMMPASRLYGAGRYHLVGQRRAPVPCGASCTLSVGFVIERPGVLHEVRVPGPVTPAPACGRSTPPGRCAASP